MIYADHAATTKISETAKLAMLSAMEKDWYNPSSLYTPGQQASGTLMDARVRIARCLGCLPKHLLRLCMPIMRLELFSQFVRSEQCADKMVCCFTPMRYRQQVIFPLM